MPGTTSPDNLVFPVVGDTASPRTAITQLANSTQAALTSIRTSADRVVNFFGPAGSIGLVVPKDGDTYQESDGNKILWKRIGGIWATNEGGMYLIRPVVSGTGVSVDASGAVVFNAVPASATVNIDSLFSSRFENYRVVANWTAKPPNSPPVIYGKVGATIINAPSYSQAFQSLVAGARSDTQAVSQTNFHECFIPYSGSAASAVSDIMGPNLPQPTFILTNSAAVGGVTAIRNEEVCLNSTDQLTGLQIVMNTGGTYTGRVKFYGLA